MVKINCSYDTADFFGRCGQVRNLTLTRCGGTYSGYLGTVIGNCAFVPFGDYVEIYEAGEWKFGVEEEKND